MRRHASGQDIELAFGCAQCTTDASSHQFGELAHGAPMRLPAHEGAHRALAGPNSLRPKRSPRLGKDRNGTITRGRLRPAGRPQRKNEKSRNKAPAANAQPRD